MTDQEETTESIYWAMLMDLTCKIEEKDYIGRNLVEAAYRHWNTIHPSAPVMKPWWIK